MVEVLTYLIHTYELVILASLVSSWFQFPRYHPVVHTLHRLTEPVYSKVRQVFSFIPYYPIDWSPMICLLGLALLQRGLSTIA